MPHPAAPPTLHTHLGIFQIGDEASGRKGGHCAVPLSRQQLPKGLSDQWHSGKVQDDGKLRAGHPGSVEVWVWGERERGGSIEDDGRFGQATLEVWEVWGEREWVKGGPN